MVRQVKVAFADPRRSYTRAFERYALELSRRMTIRDVAAHLGVSWDTDQGHPEARPVAPLRQAQAQAPASGSPSTRSPSAKGHRYLTVVLDLESGAVVFVGDGKGADALKPFWKRLRPSGAKIEAVAMDMSAAYREAVRRTCQGAVIVFDHFHVIKLFNEKLSDLRRALYREADRRDAEEGAQGERAGCC